MRYKSWTASVAAGLLLWTGGCGIDPMLSFDTGGEGDRPAATKRQLTPDDFDRRADDAPRVVVKPAGDATANGAPVAIESPTAKPTTPTPTPPAPAPAPVVPPRLSADDATTPTGDPTLARDEIYVDAMVGQVTGKPVYASQIFNRIGVEPLTRLGQTLPRLEFKHRAAELIVANLKDQITNSLILAEAERGLTEQEQLGLLGFVQQKRTELIAEYGGGVPALAEEAIKRKKGHGLDEEVEQFRQKLLTDKYLHEKLWPKINVNRREVERYYRDHESEFSAETTVQVRVIYVPDAKAADAVDQALADGTGFAEAAKSHSRFRASDGGLMEEHKLTGPLSGYKELNWKELNAKVATLRQGERSDRIVLPLGDGKQAYGWVYIEKLVGGEGRTLEQAQLLIEQRIQSQKFGQLSRRYIADLWETGNYTPLDAMAIRLLDVAMARFARPQ